MRDANLLRAIEKTLGWEPPASIFMDGMTLPPSEALALLLHDFTVNRAHKAALTDEEHRRLDQARIADMDSAKGCGRA